MAHYVGRFRAASITYGRKVLVVAMALWAIAWGVTPFVRYVGGVAGFPWPVLWPLYGLGLAGLAFAAWGRMQAEPQVPAKFGWGFASAAGCMGALASLAALAGGEPVLPSLLIMPGVNLLVVSLVLLGLPIPFRGPRARRRVAPILASWVAVAAFAVWFTGVGSARTNVVPHDLPEGLAYVLAALAFALHGTDTAVTDVREVPSSAAAQ